MDLLVAFIENDTSCILTSRSVFESEDRKRG
jgi:hypothetical protein